jgi:hypothetical protein
MSVYGHVQWPIDTSEPVVYVESGVCPSATWLDRVSARSLPSEWLWALIFLDGCGCLMRIGFGGGV